MNFYDETLTLYNNLLEGTSLSLPTYFFNPNIRAERCKILIKYLIEDILKLEPSSALDTLTVDVLKKYRLFCLNNYIEKPVEYVKDNNNHLIYYAYPDLVKPTDKELCITMYAEILEGKRTKFPTNYFSDAKLGNTRCKWCIHYLLEQHLGYDDNQILIQYVTGNFFKLFTKYKLKTITSILFSSDLEVFHLCYQDNPFLSSDEYSKERYITLINYLIYDCLNTTPELLMNKLTNSIITKYKLNVLFDIPRPVSATNLNYILTYAYPDLQ